MRHIWTDARVGLRLLLKRPGFTTVAVLALALGIASTTAIFSVVYATLLAPLPYPEPDQLVMVWSRIKGNRNVSAAGSYLDWKQQATVFQDLNAFSGRNANLASADHPEQVQAGLTTPGFFRMVGNPMFLGRDFVAEEGQPGKDQVVILTHRMWSDRFAGDRGIVGRTIRIDGTPHTVVGVLQPGLADRQQSAMSTRRPSSAISRTISYSASPRPFLTCFTRSSRSGAFAGASASVAAFLISSSALARAFLPWVV